MKISTIRYPLAAMLLAMLFAGSLSAQNERNIRALEPGKPIERQIAEGETHSFSLRLGAGEFIHVFVYQRGVNVAATLVGPEGKKLLEADSPLSTQEAEWITHITSTSGVYKIDIRAVEKEAPPGRYEIKLEEQRRSVPGDEALLSAQRLLADAKSLYDENKVDSYRKAIEKYEQALVLYQQTGRRREEAVTLNCAARACAFSLDYKAALDRFERALSIYREMRDVHGEGATLNGIGYVHSVAGRYEEALKYFEEALVARRKAGYRAGEGKSLTNLGFAYFSMSRYEKVIEYDEQALVILRELKDRAGEANTLNRVAFAYSMTKDQAKAIGCYQQALAIERELKDRQAEASTLYGMGGAYGKAGQSESALGCYQQALAIQREMNDRVGQARTLDSLGFAYSSTNDFERSIGWYEQALAIQRELKDRVGEASTLDHLAYAFRNTEHRENAVRSYEQALGIRRELHDRAGEARTLNDLAFNCYVDKEYEKAIAWYRQELAIRQEMKDRTGEARVLHWLGNAHYDFEQYEKAMGYYDQELAIRHELKDRLAEADELYFVGNQSHQLKQYQRALDYYEQVLTIRRKLQDRKGEANILHTLGWTYDSSGDHNKGISYYEQSLVIWRELKNQAEEAYTLHSMAGVYEGLGEHDKAIGYYEQALALRREIKDRSGEASILGTLGRISLMKDHERANGYLEQALVIRREIGDRAGEGQTLNLLGLVQAKLSHYDKELAYYGQALALAREVKDRRSEGMALVSLGGTYARLNQHEKAVSYFQQALAIGRELKNRTLEGAALWMMGVDYGILRESQKALGYLDQALTIAREAKDRAEEGRALLFEGGIYGTLNQPDKAMACVEQGLAIARETKDRMGEANALQMKGFLFVNLKQAEKASGEFEQALAIAREVKWREAEAGVLGMLMAVWAERSQPRLAIAFGKKSINLFQEIRNELPDLDQTLRQGFMQGRKSWYRTLADLLAGQGRLAEAQQVLDLLKQDEFTKFVMRDRNVSPDEGRVTLTVPEAAWEKRYQEVADRLTAIGVKRGALLAKAGRTAADEKELATLEADLEVGNKAFQAFLNSVEDAGGSKSAADQSARVREAEGLMETLRDLGPGTVAVYTIMGEQGYRSILITPDVQKGYSYSIPAADLNKKVLAFRELVRNPTSDPRAAAKELYDILVKPMEKDLEGAQANTIMWSLDGALRYMPVAALYDGERYLVERFRNVIFTPASQSRLKDPVSRDWRGLGLGVSLAHEGFQPLPNVPNELNAIIQSGTKAPQGVLPGTVKLDGDFTKEGFRAELRKHYTIVHVASHFDFMPGTDKNSFLLLGDGGKLTLEEFRSMPQVLQGVELLTLSACDTAVGGEDADGKEVEGLAVLAQRQGAKAVVATLWAVADESTALLMTEFYRLRVSDPNMTKAEALRQAQLALLTGKIRGDASSDRGPRTNQDAAVPRFVKDPQRPYAHPYFWAPFLLMGNWK